jgi:hypothetical protein
VGIVAFFSESMLAFSDAIGREVAVKRLNTTTAGSTASAVPPENLELICRLNAVDIALYTAAKSNFEQAKLPTLCPRGKAATSAGTADPGRMREGPSIPRAVICGARDTAAASAKEIRFLIADRRVYMLPAISNGVS